MVVPLKIPSLTKQLRVTDSLPLADCPTRRLLVGSEKNVECIDDVCPGLLRRLALTDCAGDLGYLRGQPAIAAFS
jgi:hypothetical protein